MKKNSALAGFVRRFQEILDAMDEFDEIEELEEINAEFEDAVFLMENIDEDDEDARDEIEGALEELEDILAEYREIVEDAPEIGPKTDEFESIILMAKNNLL